MLAFGSDWSVSTPNPLLQIETAVNRISPENRSADSFYPEERISLAEALRSFTQGSAFVNHRDHDTGSIEVGKLADLVVLDRDLLDPDVGPIGDAQVDLTMINGEIVYERKT